MQVDPNPLTHPNGRCWLTAKSEDHRPPIQSSEASYGGDSTRSDCAISFKGLTNKENDAFKAFLNGSSYLRVIDGRLHAYHAYEPLPAPEDDPLMAPHWKPGKVREFGGIPTDEGWHSPGIIATAIGAGSQFVGEPERSMKILTDCGFVCLRSARDHEGKRWEQWVLHFMQSAEGPLKKHLAEWKAKHSRPLGDNADWHAEAEEAMRFITRDLNVSYGSMDMTIQRWALTSPD